MTMNPKNQNDYEAIEVEDIPQSLASLRLRCRTQDIKYTDANTGQYLITLGLNFDRRDQIPLDEGFIGIIGDLWIESTEDGKRTVIRDGNITKQETVRGVRYVTIMAGEYDFIFSEFARKEHQGPLMAVNIPHYLSVLCRDHCHALGLDLKTYITTAITDKLETAEEVGVEIDHDAMGLKVPFPQESVWEARRRAALTPDPLEDPLEP